MKKCDFQGNSPRTKVESQEKKKIQPNNSLECDKKKKNFESHSSHLNFALSRDIYAA